MKGASTQSEKYSAIFNCYGFIKSKISCCAFKLLMMLNLNLFAKAAKVNWTGPLGVDCLSKVAF